MSGKTTVFVMMPSGHHGEYQHGLKESDFIYKSIIREAVLATWGEENCFITREIDSSEPGSINRKIIEKLFESDFAIVDITGHNPNVFFELGVRYALKKSTTVLLKQKSTIIPFDIANYRVVEYDILFDGPDAARQQLGRILEKLKDLPNEASNYSDSPVYEALPNLQVETLTTMKKADASMPWLEYWTKVNSIANQLRDEVNEGKYAPDIIIGISNGGMIFADLLSRILFPTIPVVSFWANRDELSFFKNEFNSSLMDAIKNHIHNKINSKKEILVLDDIVASGNTVKQVFDFIKSNISGVRLAFIPLFSKNEKYYSALKEYIIWEREGIKPSKNVDFKSLHETKHHRLPYEKDIRSS